MRSAYRAGRPIDDGPRDTILPHAAFRYSSFRYYMTARFLITVSSEMQSVAVAWQVYGLTHRPLDLGLVGLAQFLPGIFLFLIAGHAADRVPRKRILQTCYAAFSICSLLLLVLTLHGLASAYSLYLVLLMNGAVRAFNAPAGQAFLPLLVTEEHFPNAVAWSSSIFQTATIVGPMAGGLLFGLIGRPLTRLASTAIAYLTGLLLLSAVRPRTAGEGPRADASLRVVIDGFRYIWRNKLV